MIISALCAIMGEHPLLSIDGSTLEIEKYLFCFKKLHMLELNNKSILSCSCNMILMSILQEFLSIILLNECMVSSYAFGDLT